jgi:hypothetical protein
MENMVDKQNVGVDQNQIQMNLLWRQLKMVEVRQILVNTKI